MKKNFSIDQGNAIICDGVLYDLHNCYDVNSIIIKPGSLCVHFTPNPEHSAGQPSLTIKCDNISYLVIIDDENIATVTHLEDIGYATSQQHTLDYAHGEEHVRPDDRLVLDFDICTIRFYGTECCMTLD